MPYPSTDSGRPAPASARAQAAIEAAGRHAGTVVAVHGHGVTSLLCHGHTDRTRTLPVTDRTRFEIGSATKTFTALLLATLAAHGTLALDEPLARHVPSGALPRGPGATDITARHLATHTAGLPRLPPGLLRTALATWTTNPYQSYSPDLLWASLARTRLRHPPGTRRHYSNFGVGLLGHLMSHAAGRSYSTLLRDHVLHPLGLTDTTDDPGCAQATGHWHGRPRPPSLIPALPAAGAVRSSARDLLHYLRCLAAPDACAAERLPRGTALRTALHTVLHPGPPQPDTPLGWSRRTVRDRHLYFHSGGTRGFTAFIGFCPHPLTAVVALTNTSPAPTSRFVQNAYLLLRSQALT
ncbi:serine hydrolase domain-containing protein [Streptomyces sp. NPDC006307]|uniref:serine hydrolase domain-containing protein n=1 Tax=Streptomyces sp. NPDC006307 TaxID=3156748 RepID=UPI0033AB186A